MYRRRKKKSGNFLRTSIFVLLGMILLWLILSLIKGQAPLELIKNSVNSSENSERKLTKPELANLVVEKDSLLKLLQLELDDCQGKNSHRRATIDIESETLNMRNKPSLSSEIVMQIPDSSEVKILFFDTEKYILNDSMGRWCKISYAETQGWVWGNFLKMED